MAAMSLASWSGSIGDADAAGEVDEGDVAAGLLLQLHSQLEENPGQGRVVLIGEGVGGQEGVEAELLDAQGLELPEGLKELLPGHAVLGVAGGVHDLEALPGVPQSEHAAGIVAAAHLLRHPAQQAVHIFHMGDVIQIDDGAQLGGQGELILRRVVGGEHDLLAPDAAPVGHHQLRQGGAVRAAALLLEQLQNGRGGGGLDGKIFPIAGVPGKRRLQAAGVFTDALLVIDVEGGGVLGRNGLELIQRNKWCFHPATSNFSCVAQWAIFYYFRRDAPSCQDGRENLGEGSGKGGAEPLRPRRRCVTLKRRAEDYLPHEVTLRRSRMGGSGGNRRNDPCGRRA